jgi:superfamily II DNA/RNA helicase
MAKSFAEFSFRPEIVQALADVGYKDCTPIQEQAMGAVLEGHDLTGLAETGSGKTAAFLLPILEKLEPGGDDPRALIIAPTRELALQVAAEAERLSAHLKVRVICVYGGTGLGDQKNKLLAGVDLVVGTPGRLIDFVRQTYLRLSKIRWLVLDEADRMLDMGFVKDMEFVMSKAPMSRQTLLFSATFPPEILALAGKFMHEPVHVAVERPSLTARNIVQVAYSVGGTPDKLRRLKDLLRTEKPEQALIFVATRERTAEVADVLRRSGEAVASISSLLSQVNRERVLAGFRDGTHKILVGTDVAGRGLDISGITHVFNFDVPHDPNDYVHRVGRTGRAGRSGRALTLVSGQDRPYLKSIENHIGMKIERAEGFTTDEVAAAAAAGDRGGRDSRRGTGSRGAGGRSGGGAGRGGNRSRTSGRAGGGSKTAGGGSGSGGGRGRNSRRGAVKKPGGTGGGQKPSSGSTGG